MPGGQTLVRLIGFSNAEREVSKQGLSFVRSKEIGTNDASGATAFCAANDDVCDGTAPYQSTVGGSTMDSE